ncbi:MAG: hypothetical protein AABY11_00680, partial [archaeon]
MEGNYAYSSLSNGVPPKFGSSFYAYIGGIYRRVGAKDTALIREMNRVLGSDATENIFLNFFRFTGARQLAKLSSPGGKVVDPLKRLFLFLRDFVPYWSRIVNNPSLKKNGYHAKWVFTADLPFRMRLVVLEEGDIVGSLNVDFFYRKKMPSVMVGSFQGGSKKAVSNFNQRMGVPFGQYLLRIVNEGFPEAQRFALHPRRHAYTQLESPA